MNRFRLSCILALGATVASCASQDSLQTTTSDRAPFRAKIEQTGFATILSAQPATFQPQQPPAPEPRTAAQNAADADFQRIADYQNSVADEAMALAERLRREERGNFVTNHYDNEGELGVVFEFLRDGPQTLRRYSDNPTFRGETVRWSREELRAAADFMWETFREDRVVQSTGIGTQQVTAQINVSEAEFAALVKRKGVTLPEPVKLVFGAAPVVPLANPPRPAAKDRAVPTGIAPYLRIFPRHDRRAGVLNAMLSRVTVVLKDGCFRAADRGDALVLFPLGAQLFVDSENYLAFGTGEQPYYARVGEAVAFMGSVNEVTTPELVDPIHAACGPGKVIKVEGLESAAARAAQENVTDRANAARRLQSEYGLDARQAERALAWLDARQSAQRQTSESGATLPRVSAAMIVMSPPPPVMTASECPAGTRHVSFLCRTPEGHLRPLPSWLREFLEQDR